MVPMSLKPRIRGIPRGQATALWLRLRNTVSQRKQDLTAGPVEKNRESPVLTVVTLGLVLGGLNTQRHPSLSHDSTVGY